MRASRASMADDGFVPGDLVAQWSGAWRSVAIALVAASVASTGRAAAAAGLQGAGRA